MKTDRDQVRMAFESGDAISSALKTKHAIESAQHISVIKMASEKIEEQRALLSRTIKMFDGAISGDLAELLKDIRRSIAADKLGGAVSVPSELLEDLE